MLFCDGDIIIPIKIICIAFDLLPEVNEANLRAIQTSRQYLKV